MNIILETDAIVIAIGAMGTGKSTFLSSKFARHDILSSDQMRRHLTGDFEDQSEDDAVWKIMSSTLDIRAEHGIFTVVDSTGPASLLDHAVRVSEEYARPLYAFIFPHLAEEEVTPKRMRHRMRYIDSYYRQVERINDTDLAPRFIPIVIPKRGRNLIEIEFQDASEHATRLSNEYRYVVIPDLHGEYRVLEQELQKYPDDGTKFLLLGDLVDRGESSYRTFRLARDLCERGKAVAVPGNHDDKLVRYFKAWIADVYRAKYLELGEFDPVPSYGFDIAYGLNVTLREFYSLDSQVMDAYAQDFIAWIESLPLYRKLVGKTRMQFFAHASMNSNLMLGRKPSRKDKSVVLYHTVRDMQDFIRDSEGIARKKELWLHVGHDHLFNQYNITSEGRYHVVHHDIGFGKILTADDERPEFMVIHGETYANNEKRASVTLSEC